MTARTSSWIKRGGVVSAALAIGLAALLAQELWHRRYQNYYFEDCDCYFNADCIFSSHPVCARTETLCISGQGHNRPAPNGQPKNTWYDGKCWNPSPLTRMVSEEQWGTVPAAFDVAFDAFISLGAMGGRPGPEQIKRIDQATAALPEEAKELIMTGVLEALDITLGYDFKADPVPPPNSPGKRMRQFGAVLPLTVPKPELLSAVSQGFQAAMKERNSQAIRPAIEEFWGANPEFRLMHTGRCFPHGHDQVKTSVDAKECQIRELSALIDSLLEE